MRIVFLKTFLPCFKRNLNALPEPISLQNIHAKFQSQFQLRFDMSSIVRNILILPRLYFIIKEHQQLLNLRSCCT